MARPRLWIACSKQSGTFAAHEKVGERVMDSNAIERERGITILSKNCADRIWWHAHQYRRYPGARGFRRRSRARALDGRWCPAAGRCSRRADAPDPLRNPKALALGLQAIVVVNKIDRPGARAGWVVDQTFELFDKLGASDAQLDFPVIYASALQGWASTDMTRRDPDMTALFEAILQYVPAPPAEVDAPLQLQISTLDYNPYVGRIGIGRILRGTLRAGRSVALRYGQQDRGTARIAQVLRFHGLQRTAVDEAPAGDIVAVTGIEDVNIGLTICDLDSRRGCRRSRSMSPLWQ